MSMDIKENLFWGLVLKPDKRYEQEAPESFHVSKACVEPQSVAGGGGGLTSVYLEKEGGAEEFLLCNLSSKETNVNLDLNFGYGEKVCFRTSGQGCVHLSGYLHQDESQQSGWESDSDDEEEMAPDLVKANSKAILDKDAPFGENDLKAAVKKAKKMQAKIAQQSKKVPEGAEPESDSEDDSDDDEDDEDDSEEGEEDDSDDDEGEEDSDDDDEDESVEEEEESKMDTSGAGSTPFKKQKGDKNRKENGSASAKKDKPKDNKENSTPKKQKDQKTPKKDQKTPKKESNGTPVKPEKGDKTPKKEGKGANTPAKQGKTPKRTVKGGVVVEELSAGNGPEARRGKMVGMYYEGRLKGNNKKFDACQSGKPFKFRLGHGEVIKGWDLGVEGMKVGGKRRLTVPANMAYGDAGAAPDIPPKSMLVFDVECKYVN